MPTCRALAASLILAVCTEVLAQPSPAADLASRVAAATEDTDQIGQQEAERLFAAADAAIWFPETGRARWLASSDPFGEAAAALFAEQLEHDYPLFRVNAHGSYLLKIPVSSYRPPTFTSAVPAADGTVFTESFESGLTNWTLDDNTLGLYSWGTSTCEARTGSRSADSLRGGVNTLTCTSAYAPNVNTEMVHKGCEGIRGAGAAWLDAWIHIDTESGADTLAFYYADEAGRRHGYGFSGTWPAWFHVVMNLKQWYRVGDVTATACPALSLEFDSDGSVESGMGVRVDDITITDAAPSFLAAAINASPATGAAPLTVNFAPIVTGASGNVTYYWTFGDSASSTSTSRNPSFTYAAEGDYSVRLRVEEGAVRAYAHTIVRVGSTATCSVTCTADAASSGATGSAVPFQADATRSNCSSPVSYSWQFGDGQTSAAQNPSHVYTAAGNYTWSVTATAGAASCTKSGSIAISSGTASSRRRRAVSPPADMSEVARTTIGSSGGTIAGGGITLTIPTGAFGSSVTIALTKSSKSRSAGDLSAAFGVEGLPATLGADLALSIELDSTPSLTSTEIVQLSFGALAMNRDREVKSMPFLLPATLSGRTASATVPASWGSGALANARQGDVSALAYTGDIRHEIKVVKRTPVMNDHFNVYAAPDDYAWAQGALATLEEAYQRLGALGFSWGCRAPSGRAFVRIPIYIASLGTGETDPYGDQNSRLDPCGTALVFTDFIALNKDYPVSSPEIRAAIGHELFHFLQEMYVPTSLTDPNRGLWIAEASSTWFETLFGSGSCPGVMTGGYAFSSNGLFNPTGSAVEGSGRRQIQNHGYGAAAFLKYHSDAADVANDPFVRSIWDGLKSGNSDLESVQNALGSSVPDFWTRFSRDSFEGRAGCSTYQQFTQKFEARDSAGLVRTFSLNAYPLSAKSFGLDLKALATTDTAPLVVTATGLIEGQTVYLYDVKSKNALGQLTRGTRTYSITDVAALKGSILVIVFVDANLPAASAASTNQVTITTGGVPGVGRFWLQVPTKAPNDWSLSRVDLYDVSLSWNGNSFSFTRNETFESGVAEGSGQGTISADGKMLTSFRYDYHARSVLSAPLCHGGTSCRDEEWLSVTLTNVPFVENKYYPCCQYSAGGSAARSMVTSWSRRWATSGWGVPEMNHDTTYPIDESHVSETAIEIRVTK